MAVCAPDSDITFQSCDNVVFKVHRINLQMHAGGFDLPEFGVGNEGTEVVRLPENGQTLDLLFRFCYPNDRPDLEKLRFERLVLLAEAGENYQVYALMNICEILMK
jgi:hypothetical protein